MADTSVTKVNKGSLISRIKRFFKDTKAELKKVTWPTKEQLIHNTGVIITFIILVMIILSLLDVAFTQLFKWVTTIL